MLPCKFVFLVFHALKREPLIEYLIGVRHFALSCICRSFHPLLFSFFPSFLSYWNNKTTSKWPGRIRPTNEGERQIRSQRAARKEGEQDINRAPGGRLTYLARGDGGDSLGISNKWTTCNFKFLILMMQWLAVKFLIVPQSIEFTCSP